MASERRGGRYPARPAQRGAHGQSEDQLLHRQCGEGDKVVKASTFERARSLSVHVRLSEIKYCTDVHPADDVRCTREMEVSACRGSPFVFRVPRRLAPPKLFAPTTRAFCNGRTGQRRPPLHSFDTIIRPARRSSTFPPHSRRPSRSWLSITTPAFARRPRAKLDSRCWSDSPERSSFSWNSRRDQVY